METQDKIIKKFHSHPLYFLGSYLMGIVIAIFGFLFFSWLGIFGILVIVLIEISRICENFFIMESGVGREYKLLSVSRKFVGYDKIQDIAVSQSFIENIFGIGTVKFDTAGTDGIELYFRGIKNPREIEKIVRGRMISK